MAASKDWINWRFVGYCWFDGVEGKPDMKGCHWAPGITRNGDTYHMLLFLDHTITHYTAPANDLLKGWKKVKKLILKEK